MKEDSQNQQDAHGARSMSRLLTNHQAVVDRLFAESGGSCWGLTRELFEVALERSVSKHVGSAAVTPEKLEEFLGALHLADLALATACDSGHPDAWNYFVVTYRGYLRCAAGAVLRRSAGSPEACELADSLFAELYGLSDAKPGGRSLLRYFHGRSSLKTWLRAVLAQRHVDAIRAGRRFTELDGHDRDGPSPRGASQVPTHAPGTQSPGDPHRERYLAWFTRTLEVALGLLDPRDHQRLRWYYAEERTLAAIGRALGEHESSVSRNLERIRRELRRDVEAALRKGRIAANGSSPEPGLSDQEIALCFEYASEDAPIDLDKLFPRSAQQPPKPGSQE
jgi:RNA polymerase sigma factor (sigma-70 family)